MLEISKLNKEDLMAYWDGFEDIDEQQLAIEEASDEWFKKGMNEGKQEDAQSMLAEGLDPALVARITKLPKEQIMAMR
jgi:predicted transposase/invertase (TIGR01784 family)